MTDRRRHWDSAYQDKGVEAVSWYQHEPVMSLELIRLLGVEPSEPVIDVGGGASLLVDRLAHSGFSDLSVLDVSEVALDECRHRLKSHPHVTFIQKDILAWHPSRRFGLWHDRAVFHFLTDERDKDRYMATMGRALKPHGAVVIGAFAQDGPTYCSGLPVARYSPAELADLLGPDLTVMATRKEIHHTPDGAKQPFSWIAAKSEPAADSLIVDRPPDRSEQLS
jgi:SAM-dependent methyltransferase